VGNPSRRGAARHLRGQDRRLAALAAEPAETGVQDSGALDTIVVVARKRQENVQSVPISIAALTGAALQQRGVARVGDLVGSVPNLTQDGGGSVLGAMGIRGIVSQTRNIGFDSGLGVYVDGVLTVRPNAADQELPDIATLEVLRGPQGTLFGRNTTAGAINITTRKPSLDGIEANARTAFGNLGTIEASLFATAPIVTDRLGVKIAGSIATRDGYITNLFDGSKLNNLNRKSLRGDLLWKPTETLEVALSGSWLKQADRLLLGQVADNTSGGLAGCRATSPIPTPSRRTIPACKAARSGAPTSTSTGTSAGSRSPRSAPMATTVRA
jgi:iron complex outermembrane receptor protein